MKKQYPAHLALIIPAALLLFPSCIFEGQEGDRYNPNGRAGAYQTRHQFENGSYTEGRAQDGTKAAWWNFWKFGF